VGRRLASLAATNGRALALALILGGGGGFLFSRLNLPLAWMLGAMTATTLAAVGRLPVTVPPRLRMVMIAVLGVMLGSAFRPAMFARVGEWSTSLSALAFYIAAVAVIIGFYFRKAAGYDRPTAFFSAIPGGLSEMILVGGGAGGDDRTIALTHAARILLVVLIIPFWFRFTADYQPGGSRGLGPSLAEIGWFDLAVLTLSGIGGYLGARACKLPSAALIGPMAFSALAHLSGLTASRPPFELILIAQLVIGASIGCRFAGVALAPLARAVAAATGSTVLMLGLCVAVAAAIGAVTGLPGTALVLALAPGGLAEMSLIALALGIDPAFVSTHHIARIFIIVTLAPLAYRLLTRDRRD